MSTTEKKSVSELMEELKNLRQIQMKLRMQKVSADGPLEKTHQIRQVRRNIARVKTFLSQQNVKV